MGSTLWTLGIYILLSQVSTEFNLASSLLEPFKNVGQRDSYNGEYWSYSLIVPPRDRSPRAFFVVCWHSWLCYSVMSPSSHSTNNIHIGKYPRRHLKRLRGTKIDMTRLHKRPTIRVLLQTHMNINAVHSKQSADKNREPHHSWGQWLNRKSACSFRVDQALTLESVFFGAIRFGYSLSSKGKKKRIKAVYDDRDYSESPTHIGSEPRIRGFGTTTPSYLQYTNHLGRLGLRTGPISATFQRHIGKPKHT